MAEYKDCYIAYFDILGFKSMVAHLPCSTIQSIFQTAIRESIDLLLIVPDGDEKRKEQYLLRPEDIQIKVLSDSIIIFTEAQNNNSLYGLIVLCAFFQAKMLDFSLTLPDLVFLRGGIANGNLYYDGNIIFGQGLIDAYLLESENARVPRVIFPQILFSQSQNGNESIKSFAQQMIILEKDQFYSLNYIYVFCQLIEHKRAHAIEDLYAHIQQMLATTTSPSIREKYLYLKNKVQPYYDHREENHA